MINRAGNSITYTLIPRYMNRKVKIVVGLAVFFLVLANVLQVGWLYTNYQETNKQYEQSINSAFGQACLYYQLNRRQNTDSGSSPLYVISSNELPGYKVSKTGTGTKIEFSSKNLRLDSIGPGLGRSQLLQIKDRNHPFNHTLLDSLFRNSLLKKGIITDYLLDTVRTPQVKRPINAAGKNELVASRAGPVQHYAAFPVVTSQMLLNNYDHLFVYASVKKQPGYILKQMLWVIVANLLIFIIVNTALLYIIKTIRQQKKLAEIKNDFINNMTHELHTPIAIATAAIDSLLNHHNLQDTGRIRSYLEISRNELLHLDGVVEKIMAIALDEKTTVELHYEAVPVQTLLKTIISNHLLVATKQINFHLDDAAGDIVIHADKFHLANAVNNIIDNAVKYSMATVNISIRYFIKKDTLIIEITDDGIGIPQQYREDIFHPFFRVPQGNLHAVKGFGLGLSYVKKMIGKHNGFIDVKSELHKGTSFTLSIPVNHG